MARASAADRSGQNGWERQWQQRLRWSCAMDMCSTVGVGHLLGDNVNARAISTYSGCSGLLCTTQVLVGGPAGRGRSRSTCGGDAAGAACRTGRAAHLLSDQCLHMHSGAEPDLFNRRFEPDETAT